MKRFLRWSGIFLLTVLLLIAGLLTYARFHDGPLEIISGGPFTSGEPSATPASWEFVRDYSTIEFQTLNPPRSRTVWLGVYEGRLFIVSGYMNTTIGALWKQWPYYLDEDDRVIVRVDGNLYEQRLQRIMRGPEVDAVLAEFDRKYGAAESSESVANGDTWMFEVLPR